MWLGLVKFRVSVRMTVGSGKPVQEDGYGLLHATATMSIHSFIHSFYLLNKD